MSLVPKKFLNETANAVNEVIEGLLLTQPNRLQRLEGHDVVLMNPIPTQQKVQLLSGGGSGHEPCFAGFVGSGMLSGAVCGGVSDEFCGTSGNVMMARSILFLKDATPTLLHFWMFPLYPQDLR